MERKVLVELHDSPTLGRRVIIALKDRRVDLTMMEAEDLAARIMDHVDADFEAGVRAEW